MAIPAATTWSTNDLRGKEGDIKISEPGIYSGLSLSEITADDKKFKYVFAVKDSNLYTDIAIFPEANPSFASRTVEQQQKTVVENLISIADAVGTPVEVSKLPTASSYMQLVNMLHKYIESKKGAKVNIKIVLDADQNFANVAKFGFIEKHTDGQDPKLWFSQWEKDNDRAKRTKPRPKAEAKSDSSTYSMPEASAVLHDKPLADDGTGLPF